MFRANHSPPFRCSVTLVMMFLGSPASLCAEMLTLNTTGHVPLNDPQQSGFMDLVANAAFKKINVDLITVSLPAERGLLNANAGIEDGEMSRITGLDKVYPNLLRVPEKLMDWHFVAFSKKPIVLADGWNSLSAYLVAYINGWKILEKQVPTSSNVTTVRNVSQLFTLLEKNRVDIIIYEKWGGLAYIKKHGLQEISMLNPPLAIKDMYIYLNKKHHALVGPLATALKELKTEGKYQAIYSEVLQPLLSESRN